MNAVTGMRKDVLGKLQILRKCFSKRLIERFQRKKSISECYNFFNMLMGVLEDI